MARLRLSVLAVLCLFAAAPLRADDEPKADIKKLDAMMDKALKAYNEGDHKKFFADYAKAMEAVATEQVFKHMYADRYMKAFGKWKEKSERKFLDKRSVLTGEVIVVHWLTEFEKKKKVMVSANFMKEGAGYKLMQIQFNEAKEDEDKDQ